MIIFLLLYCISWSSQICKITSTVLVNKAMLFFRSSLFFEIIFQILVFSYFTVLSQSVETFQTHLNKLIIFVNILTNNTKFLIKRAWRHQAQQQTKLKARELESIHILCNQGEFLKFFYFSRKTNFSHLLDVDSCYNYTIILL